MNKKVVVLIFSLLTLFLILNLVIAQDIPGLSSGANPDQIVDAANKVGNITGNYKGQWSYIEQELPKMLLQNSIVKAIDSFLQKISFLFFIFFAKPYTLSLTLFMIIALWTYFLVVFSSVLKFYASLSKWVSRVVALLAVIIMAHVKAFEAQINFLTWLGFGDKPWWVKVIIWAAVVGLLILVLWLIKKFGKNFLAHRKKMKEEINRMKLEMGAEISETFGKTIGKSLEEEGK